VFFAAVCAGVLMRVICTDGRFFEYDYPDDVRLDAALIEQTLAFHAKPDGCIDHLCLDFSGSYVPIAHVSELRLVSALVRAYAAAGEARLHEQSPVRRHPLLSPAFPVCVFVAVCARILKDRNPPP